MFPGVSRKIPVMFFCFLTHHTKNKIGYKSETRTTRNKGLKYPFLQTLQVEQK